MKVVTKLTVGAVLGLSSLGLSAQEMICSEFQQLVSDGLQNSLKQSFENKDKAPDVPYSEVVPPAAEETLLITGLKLVRKGYTLEQIGKTFQEAEQGEMLTLVMTPVFECSSQPDAKVSDVLLPHVEKLIQAKTS